ncbi:Protein TSSC4 [Holothuria leucospilota]|uniref:U5 small nuclear ribonucleoprotein TSSC4 n=1 Tax=Holothuria leucospilota TaxID=206669 RepID=A0A9Q1HGE2_HOLLE|nr:Protein TSSC4 [Holothuria leucospilota]
MAAEEDADNSGTFNLDGGDSASFESKKTDIFGSLDVLEKHYQSKVAARLDSDSKRERDSQKSRNGYDREEDDGDREFKRPRSPKAPRRNDFRSKAWSRRGDVSRYRNRKPDFEMNPEKWKKYSLEDTEVCGNAQNSRVAFDLIRQLRQRREEAEGLGEGSQKADLDQKIVFTKPTLSKLASSKTEKQPSSFGSVHKMQEFNFGKKDRKAKSRGQNFEKSESVSGGNSLSLEHLDNEPGEDIAMTDQSDNRSEKLDQSDERSEKRDDSGLSKGEVPTEVKEQTKLVSTEEVPASVSFKKRKGKRNIRSRQDEETD